MEIEKIHVCETRKKVEDQIQEQVKIVNQHVQQAQQFAKQLPPTAQLANASIQAYQLATNHKSINDQILQYRIAQAQQFLVQHQQFQLDNGKQQRVVTKKNGINNSKMQANGQLPAVAPINVGIGVNTGKIANNATTTTAISLTLADPVSYTQYSRNLYDNRNGQWKDKQEYKDDKNENERLNLKFTGKEEELQDAAMTFIKNIQTEAETLIAGGVFSESLFVNHIIYKCIKDNFFFVYQYQIVQNQLYQHVPHCYNAYGDNQSSIQ